MDKPAYKRFRDIEGNRFGRLIAIKYAGKDSRKSSMWNCLCDCGTSKIISSNKLIKGNTKSCGCLHKEVASGLLATHRKTRTAEYVAWVGIKGRCLNTENKNYSNYGGRGIGIDDRWAESFENFLDDMGNKPTPSHSIDRIDNDGNYSLENCRWATKKVQARNRRITRTIEYNGESKSLAEWAEVTGIHRATIASRISAGWTTGRALGKEAEEANRG